MKKIAIVTSFLLAVIFPRPGFAYLMGVTEAVEQCHKRDYAVVYMNGVLNSEIDAEFGKNKLMRALGYAGLDNYKGRPVIVYKAFNPSHFAGADDSITVAIQKAFDQAQKTLGLDYDAKEMIDQMHREVKEGRILFVPHSQGNFYANSIYTWLATHEGGLATSSMAMYNVASPAQMMAQNPRYILSKNDKVIAGLVGSVGAIAPPNVTFPENGASFDELGHNFVDTYLFYGGEQMMKDIKAQLATLDVDAGKDQYQPCIPESNAGIAHELMRAYYALVDPITIVVRNTALELANFTNILVGSVFSSNDIPPTPELIGTAHLPDLSNTHSSSLGTITAGVTAAQDEDVKSTTKKSAPRARKTKVPKPPKVDPEKELKLTLLERITLLKRLLKAEAKLDAQKVSSSVIRGGGGLPTARAHALDEAAAIPVVPSQNIHWEVENNLPHSQEENAIDPMGHVLLSEYYIGKEGEASWVEIMNTSDKWIDMRNAEFVDAEGHKTFPLTGIPPKKFVVLRSSGTMAHAVLQSDAPYRVFEGLVVGEARSGEFAVLSNHSLLDRAPYGPNYCANDYALRRSCERMITALPGDNPDYWVRARALETPTQYENASTIGYANQSWKYNIYEGRKIVGLYPNELIPRGQDAVYVTGTINIPSGEDVRVDNVHPWILAVPDAAIFGGAGQTVVHVYGTLNIWKTGSIGVNKNFASYNSEASRPVIETIPYILVHEGGVLVRDPYTYLTAPVVIRGGIVRTNTLASRMRLESGKLYLTYYPDGTSPLSPPICDEFKDNSYSPVEWLGGKLYRMGIDCGSSLFLSSAPEGLAYIGPDDPFGVVVPSGNDYECGIYYAVRNKNDCADYFGVPIAMINPPPVVDTNTGATTTLPTPTDTGTSTATSTDPVPPPVDSGGETSTSTSTSTPPIADAGGDSATSTSTSTPPIDDSGTVLGTSTASTTPPIPDQGGEQGTSTSTSTPPIDNSGSSSSTTTASTTPQVFCYEGPTYYEGITLEELNATCGHGWAPRPTLFPVASWGWNPLSERLRITEYYIGAGGEASWFKVSNMMGAMTVDLGMTDIFLGDARMPFPVLSIPKRQYVILQSDGALAQELPTISMNGGVETTAEYIAVILPSANISSGSIRFSYTTSPRFPGTDVEVLNFERGVCPGILTAIGSCVLERPYLVGNYAGDAGYVPWSMPEVATSTPPATLAMPAEGEEAVPPDGTPLLAQDNPPATSTPELAATSTDSTPPTTEILVEPIPVVTQGPEVGLDNSTEIATQ